MLPPPERLLLEIEAARMCHAWALAQIEAGHSTPAITKYVGEALEELRVLEDKLHDGAGTRQTDHDRQFSI